MFSTTCYYKTTNYDQRKLKAHKSCEDYTFFFDGYEEQVQIKELRDDDLIIKSCVKLTQKGKTYLNKSAYDVWILLSKTGSVKCAYCTCIGG
jgi:hypothetical protein